MDSQQVLYSTTGPVRVSIPHNASVQQRNYTTTTTYQVPGESQSTAKFSSSRAGRIEAPKQFAVQEEYQEEIPIQQPGYTELHCVQSQQNLTATQSIPSQSFSYVQQHLSAVASAPLFQEHVQTQYVMQQQPQVQTQYVIQQQPQVQTQYVIQQQPQVQTQYVIQQQPNYYVQGSLTHSSNSSFSQSALLPLQATSLHQTSLNNIHSQQQQQQLYQYVEVEGPPQYVEVPGPKQYVEVPQPPKLVEIPQPSVRVEIDSPSQIVRVPSPRHLVQVPVGQVATSFVSQSQVGVKPGGSPVVSTLEVASPSSGSSRVSYHVPPQSHGTSSLPVRVETSDVRSSNTAQHGQTTSTHTSSTSSVSHTNSVTGVKVSTGSEVKTGAVQNHVERTSNNKESDDKSSMQVRSRALPDGTSFPLAEHSNPRVEAHAAVDSNENQAKSYTPPRSPRLRNRVRLLIPFDTKQRELIKRLDIGDRCRIGQALREDVATHFAALVPVDTATIMAPMEFNKDGAITVAFDISPSLPEARKDEIQARGTVSVNLSKTKVALSEFDL